ncbi:hypothetical protein A11A3_00285 [Alcanivorax hongdengensis A-11-3]|uniref:Cyclic nucleotide-binding protein n=1 Tax=Alcanivorax hongdengensis A-11-3 TaxID=1177179 RepID=L0WJ95_9GAMM|nr:DUF294 nucleotidyltransferase-like domain-containing protein [Alcanivorax hongdengensis]EKF75885.1 hypothetical protein A11A3_00285 [Alcanivorax hongdengensis A-11-3]
MSDELQHYPFTLLSESGREHLQRCADLAYFQEGEIILDAGESSRHVYVVHKGSVAELDVAVPSERARLGVYTSGDIFGAISVISGKSRYRFRAEQQTLCYLIAAQAFISLCEKEPAFADYFRQRLVEKGRRLAEQREGGVTMAGFMLARIADCMREPLVMAAGSSLRQAVEALKQHGVDSVLIEQQGRYAIVTKTDLLTALVLEERGVDTPLSDVAESHLVTATPQDYLFSALVRMTRHKIARVVVMDNAKAVGVVELADVLSYFSSRSYVVGLELEKAENLEALARASARLPELVETLMAQGVKMRFAMDLLAALNARLMSKAFEMTVPADKLAGACLMVMGSEGRGEQMLKTDQDNGLILADHLSWPDCASDMERFSETLQTLGYPPCPGRVMVSNPDWRGSARQWRERILRWADVGDGEAIMRLTIILDAHAVAGDVDLLERVRDALFERCRDDQLLLQRFARPVLQFSSPLTLFGKLKKSGHGIDVKKGGLFPLIHGVRAMALEQGIRDTSTSTRLKKLVAAGAMEAAFGEDLQEALELFSELRLKQQLAQWRDEQPPVHGNQVMLQQLSSLERDLLRDALKLVNEFKQRLSRRFHLEY